MSRKHRRRLFWTLVALVYGGLMLFGGCANRLILFPSTQPIPANGAKRITVDMGGGKIVECWVDRSRGARGGEPAAYVIEFTGNATRAEQIASYAADRWGARPIECWAVNYPGYGGSTGPAKLAAIAPAALAVYDHVAKLANAKPIFLAGNSLGTTAALHLAAKRPCAGMILQNPPAIRSLILRNYGWWNLWLVAGPIALQVPRDLDGPTHAALSKAPAVFLLAKDDDFVVPSNQVRVSNAYAGPKHIINTTGGHNGYLDLATERQLSLELQWLWESAGLPAPVLPGK